ncbi:MAG: transglutaminase-like domain-containing protein [Pirellulaceae bacterium]
MPTKATRASGILRGLIGLLLLTVTACKPAAVAQEDGGPEVSKPGQAEKSAPRVAANSDPAADPDVLADRWSAIVQQGQKIGFGRETVRRDQGQGGGPTTIRTTSIQQFQIKRLEQTITMRVENIFLETEEGHLLEYASKMSQGRVATLFRGKRLSTEGESAQFEITTTQAGRETGAAEKFTWDANLGGMHAQRLALEDPPIAASQQRERLVLVPLVNRPGMMAFAATKPESVEMIGGTKVSLLRVEHEVAIEGQAPAPTTMWVDDHGVVVKMALPEQDFEILSCDKQLAMSPNQAVTFDLATETVVPVPGDIGPLQTARKATYHLRHARGNLAEMLSSRTNQTLAPAGEREAKLTVYRIDPKAAVPTGIDVDDAPSPADRQPSSLVQSDDEVVLKLAAGIPDKETPLQTALAAEKLVHETVTEKNFSQGFATAADVARAREGDCTEHSVLLMALLRAKGIPARAALGLVYFEGEQARGFAYHMWTEAWIDDRWIPLDATRPPGPIGVDYIKVTESSLEGSAAFSAFFPVSRVIGQIEILGVEFP